MKFLIIQITAILFNSPINGALSDKAHFDKERDLLIMQFDIKTDPDDIHSAAALFTLMSDEEYSNINYHAVAGTYGTQEGLYIPANDLFRLAFEGNWTDAHENFDNAVKKLKPVLIETLRQQGDIWIAEAGQSDFTAALIFEIQSELPELNIRQRIHVVQHGKWNEEKTTPENLKFVKKNTDYHKIPDGNIAGNGTPGFLSPGFTNWEDKITDPELLKVWQLATNIASKYNGRDGRYKNKAVAAGGLDFSDLVEVCWILGLNDIDDTEDFFDRFVR